MVKKQGKAAQGYDPGELTIERIYVQEGHEDDLSRALVVEMRSDLTIEESEALLQPAPEVDEGGVKRPATDAERATHLRERMAPFVVGWNVYSKGQPVPPPAEAGGDVFRKINGRFEAEIWRDLALRSTGLVTDSKRLTTPSSAASGTTDASTKSGSNATTNSATKDA